MLAEEAARLLGGDQAFERSIGGYCPEAVAAGGDLELAEQPPHAVTDQNHVPECRVVTLGVERGQCVAQVGSQQGRGSQERDAGRVSVNPDLVTVQEARASGSE